MTKDRYKTKDIFEGAWIYSQNIKFLGLEEDGKYFWFTFDELDTCTNLSGAYWSQKAEGNVKHFVNSYKTLKDLIYSKISTPQAKGSAKPNEKI